MLPYPQSSNEAVAPLADVWRHKNPLALASTSEGRRLALEQTGIAFTVYPPEVDERAIERDILAKGGEPDDIVRALARAKARQVSRNLKDHVVLGADQAASCEGRLFGKPGDLSRAAEQLRFLSGRAHRLHSAAALALNGETFFEIACHADLRMRAFGDSFIERYLAIVGAQALTSAGAYQIEGFGVHLFDEIEGDHWTILGLPLLPVLAALRHEGFLIS